MHCGVSHTQTFFHVILIEPSLALGMKLSE